jgi:hypothetical protein
MPILVDERPRNEFREPGPQNCGQSRPGPPPDRDEPGSVSLVNLISLAGLILLAVTVRVIATHNDLWLDELISLRTARALKTPWQIFTSVHNDNNHYLNTLYLYLVQKQSAAVYRYLSLLWGAALVPAGYWLLARRSRLEAAILSGLIACSYPLIHFSSEARGYSGAALGTVLACAALSRWIAPAEKRGRKLLLGLVYSGALMLALLSHLTAGLVWLALALGSLLVVARRPDPGKWIARWCALNLAPCCLAAVLYFYDLRFFAELGGSPMSVPHGLSRLLALGLGWPARDAWSVWFLALPLVLVIIGRLVQEEKAGEPLAVLLALACLLPPLGALLLQPSFFSPRYVLVILPFLYAAIAIVLARLGATRTGRIALTGLLALFLAGQASLYAGFLRVGRGDFRGALEYIVRHTSEPRIIVASSQDFRAGVELSYFAPRVVNKQLLYVQGDNRALAPDWYILHQEGYEAPGPEVLNTPGQPAWYRRAYFGAAELAGQAFTIYSHQPAP